MVGAVDVSDGAVGRRGGRGRECVSALDRGAKCSRGAFWRR